MGMGIERSGWFKNPGIGCNRAPCFDVGAGAVSTEPGFRSDAPVRGRGSCLRRFERGFGGCRLQVQSDSESRWLLSGLAHQADVRDRRGVHRGSGFALVWRVRLPAAPQVGCLDRDPPWFPVTQSGEREPGFDARCLR